MGAKPRGRSWREVVIAIASAIDDSALPLCPACGGERVDYTYVGDAISRIGYLVVWCNACLKGTRVSRVKAPIGVHFMPFSDDASAVAVRIPAFKEVPPH